MRAVDLFCGVGGLSKGLMEAGIEVVAGYDNWSTATDIYSHNLPHKAENINLFKIQDAVDRIQAISPDIIVGGPPCQDFSTAGNRVEGGPASLTYIYASIVSGCKPSLALIENVPQVRLSKVYSTVKSELESAGYTISEGVINASLCDVPQLRKRFFMLASREGGHINRRYENWVRDSLAIRPLTVKEYLEEEIEVEYYYRHPRNYSRRAVFTVYEPSPTIRSVNRPVPTNYKRNHLDSADPRHVRPLTYIERGRIQTFPKSWNWTMTNGAKLTKTDVEMLIGNAVPVNLARFVGKGILYACE